jgi:hypothetical protein
MYDEGKGFAMCVFGGEGEAVNCAVYLVNRTSYRGVGGKTPYEL